MFELGELDIGARNAEAVRPSSGRARVVRARRRDRRQSRTHDAGRGRRLHGHGQGGRRRIHDAARRLRRARPPGAGRELCRGRADERDAGSGQGRRAGGGGQAGPAPRSGTVPPTGAASGCARSTSRARPSSPATTSAGSPARSTRSARRRSRGSPPELRIPVELEAINSAQATWSGAQSQLPTGSLFVTLDVQPLGTRMLFTVEQSFVLMCLDLLLGGSPTSRPASGGSARSTTCSTQRLFESLVHQLSLVWQDLAGITCRSSRSRRTTTPARSPLSRSRRSWS